MIYNTASLSYTCHLRILLFLFVVFVLPRVKRVGKLPGSV